MLEHGAYRSAPADPAHVCIVCYQYAAVGLALCPECGVPLSPLGTPEVIAELRERARQRRHLRRERVHRALTVLLLLLALVPGTWIGMSLLEEDDRAGVPVLVGATALFFLGIYRLAAWPRALDADLAAMTPAALVRHLGLRVIDRAR